MATTELDPLFVKALKLLHSKSKDAGDQLKQMLDEVLSKKKGGSKDEDSYLRDSKEVSKTSYAKKKEAMVTAETQKREGEKRNLEKLKFDLAKLSSVSDHAPSKKIKLDSPSEPRVDKEKAREKEKERERERQKMKERQLEESREAKKEVKPVIESDTESEEEASMDADDFAFGMGISCIVCRQFDVSSGNQLIECQECHNLYHQECHRPPVTDQDVNDPRFVWYCSRCIKNIKKNMVQKPGKAKASPTILVKEVAAPRVLDPPLQMPVPFKRPEPTKPSAKDVGSGSKPLSGLAGLAASLSGRPLGDSGSKLAQKPDKSGLGSKSDLVKLGQPGRPFSKIPAVGSTAGVSKGQGLANKASSVSSAVAVTSKAAAAIGGKSTSGTSMMNAEKRMQIMKKKAAAKLQEKRSSLK